MLKKIVALKISPINQEAFIKTITEVTIPEGEDINAPKNIIIKRKVDGKSTEDTIPPDKIIFVIGKDPYGIKVDAEAAFHIYSRHLSEEAAGSKFTGMTLYDVLRQIQTQFDLAEVARAQKEGVGPLEEKKFVGTIDIGIKGTTGVATLDEMLRLGIITQSQVDEYKALTKDIEDANFRSDQEKKDRLIQEFNQKGYPIYLGQRFPVAPITPFFDTDPIDTTEMAIVVIDGKLITTMTGHHREKLPLGPQAQIEFAKEKRPKDYDELMEKFLTEAEVLKRLTREFYELNSPDWLNAGFIQRRP